MSADIDIPICTPTPSFPTEAPNRCERDDATKPTSPIFAFMAPLFCALARFFSFLSSWLCISSIAYAVVFLQFSPSFLYMNDVATAARGRKRKIYLSFWFICPAKNIVFAKTVMKSPTDMPVAKPLSVFGIQRRAFFVFFI